MRTNTHSSVLVTIQCLFCVGPMTSNQMKVLPGLDFLYFCTRTENNGRPSVQTEPGWGWLSCTQGNVMTKQHVPQFSGGLGKPPGRGASLQCRPAYCYVATVCLSRLVAQSSGSTSSQHDVSPSSSSFLVNTKLQFMLQYMTFTKLFFRCYKRMLNAYQIFSFVLLG